MESPTPATAQKMNLPRFLLALLINPRRAFTQLEQTSRPHFLWAAAAMLVVIWLVAIVTLPVTQREAAAGIDTALEQTGKNMSEVQRASLEQTREFATNPVFLLASQGLVETIAYPFLWASAAGVLYLLSLAFGGQARFGSVLSMTVWASIAEILGKIMLAIGTIASGATVRPGLSYLVSVKDVSSLTPVTAALVQILSKVTIFEIWYLVLIGIGIGVCAKITRPKSAVITILYWLISLIPPVAMAVGSALIASATFG
ncbi:MAG: YIP1 family protein [Anaerolineales bacterium]